MRHERLTGHRAERLWKAGGNGPQPRPRAARQEHRFHAGDDIDLFEVNEAFASVIGAWLAEHGGSDPGALWERTNVNGGAIALGHPLGATGAKLTAALVHEMERRGARYGLQTMCEGGGMANAMILERC